MEVMVLGVVGGKLCIVKIALIKIVATVTRRI